MAIAAFASPRHYAPIWAGARAVLVYRHLKLLNREVMDRNAYVRRLALRCIDLYSRIVFGTGWPLWLLYNVIASLGSNGFGRFSFLVLVLQSSRLVFGLLSCPRCEPITRLPVSSLPDKTAHATCRTAVLLLPLHYQKIAYTAAAKAACMSAYTLHTV